MSVRDTIGRLLGSVPRRRQFRILLRFGFLTVGFFAGFLVGVFMEEKLYGIAACIAAIVFLASVGEFVLADVITERRYPRQTEKILASMELRIPAIEKQLAEELDYIKNGLRGCDVREVSATLHVKVSVYSPVDERPEDAFVQVLDYQGGFGGPRWRLTPCTKGIIGRCLRTCQPEFVNFSTVEEYNDRMVREFGFTPKETKERTMSARSYWAHPVLMDSDLVAVIYLFSTEPQVFPKAADISNLNQSARHIASLLHAARVITGMM
jgi:hypothetical protein